MRHSGNVARREHLSDQGEDGLRHGMGVRVEVEPMLHRASGDMEHGIGYDYQAISAVLVGGTAIGGGEGSALRTFSGAFIIALVEGLLLLNGFSTQMQYLTIGVIVLGVIMLHTLAEQNTA